MRIGLLYACIFAFACPEIAIAATGAKVGGTECPAGTFAYQGVSYELRGRIVSKSSTVDASVPELWYCVATIDCRYDTFVAAYDGTNGAACTSVIGSEPPPSRTLEQNIRSEQFMFRPAVKSYDEAVSKCKELENSLTCPSHVEKVDWEAMCCHPPTPPPPLDCAAGTSPGVSKTFQMCARDDNQQNTGKVTFHKMAPVSKIINGRRQNTVTFYCTYSRSCANDVSVTSAEYGQNWNKDCHFYLPPSAATYCNGVQQGLNKVLTEEPVTTELFRREWLSEDSPDSLDKTAKAQEAACQALAPLGEINTRRQCMAIADKFLGSQLNETAVGYCCESAAEAGKNSKGTER